MIEPVTSEEMATGFARMRWTDMRPMEIIADVATRRGVTRREIMSGDRTARVSRVRHEAYAAVRAATRMSYPAIGRIFHRDHTTIIHGIRAHERRTKEEG
jgi:chromosomal replication initiation ATPase DnaA